MLSNEVLVNAEYFQYIAFQYMKQFIVNQVEMEVKEFLPVLIILPVIGIRDMLRPAYPICSLFAAPFLLKI